MSAAKTDRDWQAKYRDGNTPWDSGLPSKELIRVLAENPIGGSRVLELGCGTGTNAVYLAGRGFEVTAVDCSPLALDSARRKARDAGVRVDWVDADVQRFGADLEPFDFVFDRGCYHCCRRVDLNGYLETLRNATRAGSHFLCLAGNANELSEQGPPRVTEQQLRGDFSELFDVHVIREFHFEDAGGIQGPLGWSALMVRKT